MIIYAENPDGSLRGVSPLERETIEPVFTAFKSKPTSVALSFEDGNVVTYLAHEKTA